MVLLQNRKRQHADDHLLQGDRPGKKARSSVEIPNFPPQFWDGLSKIPLTTRALRELDRRNESQPSPNLKTLDELFCSSIALYARQGGPDLSHLRGYPEPNPNADEMDLCGSSEVSGLNKEARSVDVIWMSTASARDLELEQHLNDQGVYLDTPKSSPQNLHEIQEALLQPRSSLSLSHIADGDFERFQQMNERAIYESDVLNELISIFCGNTDIPHQKNIELTEFAPITNEDASKPQPEVFDGACLADIDERIRYNKQMHSLIVPTQHPEAPVAPNFFLEAKDQDGSAAITTQQACYDGAYGARAMHSLQNYGKDVLSYDGNAYTFSSTYHAGTGTLQLFAHHSTLPIIPQGQPEYHMTKLNDYVLTNDPETFIEGVTALRNARDLAKRYRDSIISEANIRAKNTPEDSEMHLYQEADAALQDDIFNNSFTEDAPMPQYFCIEDLKGAAQKFTVQNLIDLPASFAASFISTFHASRAEAMRCVKLHC